MHTRSVLLLLISQALFAFLMAAEASAQWQLNGGVVCDVVGSQTQPASTPDGRGGFLIAWQDARSGSYDIYAQRLDSRGIPQWGAGGVPICTAALDQRFPSIIGDGHGGAIVTWEDDRSIGSTQTDIYAQRIDSLGTALWSPDGVTICTMFGSQAAPMLVEDRAGGAIVIWRDLRTGTYNLFVQRVDHDGVRLWTANGNSIVTGGSTQQNPSLVSDGAGGAFIAWEDNRGPSPVDLYAQHIASDGSRDWGNSGVVVSTAVGSQTNPTVVVNGSVGIIVAWVDYRSGSSDIYAQKIIPSGLPGWTDNGVAVCNVPGDQYLGCMAPDGAGGAIVAWSDSRAPGNLDLYAQRVNAFGVPQWMPGGIVLCNAPRTQIDPKCVGDGESGMVITWLDSRFGASDVFAQRLLASGAMQWVANGTQLTKAQHVPAFSLADDSTGGAAFFWADTRFLDADIYGQRVLPTGEAGYRLNLSASLASVQDVPSDQGGWLRIALTGATGDAGQLEPLITGYNLWRRIEANSSFTEGNQLGAEVEPKSGFAATPISKGHVLKESEAASAGFPSGSWESLGFYAATQSTSYTLLAPTKQDSTAAGAAREVFLVTVHTTEPTNYSVSAPDSGSSIDNLAPGTPQNASGSNTGTSAVQITWDPNGEGDLLHYTVYKGASADFPTSPATLVGTPSSPGWVDSAFNARQSYYKIAAVDVHANESAYALVPPSQVLATDRPRGLTTHMSPANPNPFLGSTAIRLEMARASEVELRVYDVGGRVVRRLIHASLPSGWSTVVWDGRDELGTTIGPGMFFVRLSTPGTTQVQRVLRVR